MISRREFFRSSMAAATVSVVAAPLCSALAAPGNDRLLAIARRALDANAAHVTYRDVVGVTDFSAASRALRFHLVDVLGGRVSSYHVAHGRGSDVDHTGWLHQFSNEFSSNATSQGAYVTGAYYDGKHGPSMRLHGLDHTNNNAEARAVVVHGAWYVSDDMIREHGKLGRSEGCFAFSERDLPIILDRLGPGRLLFADRL